MGIGTLGPNDRSKIMALVNSGIDVLREIATLKEGLKDQVGAVSEELDIDKKILNRTIRDAYRSSVKNQNVIQDAQDELDAVEMLLKTAGI